MDNQKLFENSTNKGASMIQKVKAVINEHFPEYWEPAEACLVAAGTLSLKNILNPTGVVLTGPSSSGKSTVLRLLNKVDESMVYFSDHFTPAAFVSNHSQKSESELQSIDLLRRIENKCFIVSDLGCITKGRSEEVLQRLTRFTRVLDGEGLRTDTGVYGRRECSGERLFVFLAGMIPPTSTTFDSIRQAGSRLFFFQMPNSTQNIRQLLERQLGGLSYEEKLIICQDTVRDFFNEMRSGGIKTVNFDLSLTSLDIKDALKDLACLVSDLRGTVSEDGEIYKEHPSRAMTFLSNMVSSRAYLYGRDRVTEEDLPMLFDLAVGSCSRNEALLLKKLVSFDTEVITRKDIGELLRLDPKQVGRIVDKMKVLGLIQENGKIPTTGRFAEGLSLSSQYINLKKIMNRPFFSNPDGNPSEGGKG
jgi:energy-coupling factor transporter ATP-binding protein EcfA2